MICAHAALCFLLKLLACLLGCITALCFLLTLTFCFSLPSSGRFPPLLFLCSFFYCFPTATDLQISVLLPTVVRALPWLVEDVSVGLLFLHSWIYSFLLELLL